MQKKLKQHDKSFVMLKINLDRLKIELSGRDAHKCLKEVNKILDKVNKATDEHIDELSFDYRLESMLSDELMLNSTVAKMLNNFSQIYEDYRSNKVAIENKKVVELEKGKVENLLDLDEVKKAVHKLLFHIQKDQVKHALIHVKGTIKKEETKKVIDLIKQELCNGEIHTLFTKSEVPSHTIVEAIFFGEFATEYEN